MAEYGVDAPLCSFVYITVNGEDWGLYLAVEAVEDSFLQRNYGGEYGELYKPDSMSNGGGRGNGKNFDFSDVEEQIDAENEQSGEQIEEPQKSMNSFDPSQFDQGMVPSEVMPSAPDGFDDAKGQANTVKNDGSMIQGGFGGGMGSNDVKLQYIDDNAESYSDIFDNAKTDITDADKERLISALKNLSENTDIESTVCVDEVICYFVVHNYLCNDDSYTGTMVHNYYLYEKDGMLSMIPWDYNLAFGGFRSKDATETVNSPIDSPVSGGTVSDRPMISWIFENEEYKQLYHEYYDEFISGFFENGRFIEEITSVAEAISPYVEKDPTKFCTFEEFEIAVDTLLQFCELRALSVRGQLEGSVPSTSQGQANDASSLVDAGSINISDMGAMNTGGGKPGDKNSAMQGDVGAMMPGEDSEISNSTENESSSTMPETPNAVRPPMGEGHPGAQQGGAFGGMMGGNMMQGGLNGGMRGDAAMQNTTAQQMPSETVQTQEGPSSKNIVILVICIVLIIGGILLTKKFKR